MTRPAARVAIVIPVYNGQRTIQASVRSALAQRHPACTVIVVDDGSTDRTPEIVASIPGVTLLRQENRGPAAARNLGWRSAVDAKFVFFLDADCVAPPDWVGRLLAHHREKRTSCVGSAYGIANPESLLARVIYREFERRYEFCGLHPAFVGAHGYSFRRSRLERLGGYDESYRHASHEDNDLGWRLLRASRRLRLVRDVRVRHHFPERLGPYLRTQMRHGFWRMKLLRAHPASALGDEYSNLFDYLQPPLMLLAALLLAAGDGRGAAAGVALALAAIALALQAPVASGLRRLGSRRREVAFYSLVFSPLRALARGAGMAAGVFWFWVLWRDSLAASPRAAELPAAGRQGEIAT
ncbi:MAG TPA: glycosyltransferase family 2 protein [bacterium]